MKAVIYLILSSFIFISCKTNQLFLNVVEPAPVTLSPTIKKVGVINRSMPTDETKILDVIDKALSLEGVNLDKDGAEQSIKGLSEELLNNQRFNEVKTLSDIDFRTPKLGLFPVPLSWDIVNKICRETGTDALFSLEMYDTDTKINYSNRNVDIKGPLGVIIPGIEHRADMETIVKTGWRIYDPASQVIADEFNHVQSVVFTGKGINPLVAVAGLIGRKQAIQEVSNKAGHGYAMRLLPFELRVMRDYFVKGTYNFKIAKRRAQNGNWNEAAELWQKETTNPKRKVAGRAYYNMAIINEINGQLDDAISWAMKSYEDYNIKLAREYVRILKNRMVKTDIINVQQQK
jgi:tetratricopeptide (TPR) repeat protein